MSCLHTAIPTPSFCSFWHSHPYTPIHFLKMFFILVKCWGVCTFAILFEENVFYQTAVTKINLIFRDIMKFLPVKRSFDKPPFFVHTNTTTSTIQTCSLTSHLCQINSVAVHLVTWQLVVSISCYLICIRELVDSLCRDGADTPIVRVQRKTFLTRKRSHPKPFWAPGYSIPAFLYPTIPPK